MMCAVHERTIKVQLKFAELRRHFHDLFALDQFLALPAMRDQRGVLGKLATALGERDVSIEQMVQEGHGKDQPVSVVLLTHPAREGDLRAALGEIDKLSFVVQPTRVLRIEA